MSGRGKYSGSKRVRAARVECGVEGLSVSPPSARRGPCARVIDYGRGLDPGRAL